MGQGRGVGGSEVTAGIGCVVRANCKVCVQERKCVVLWVGGSEVTAGIGWVVRANCEKKGNKDSVGHMWEGLR